MYCIDDWVLVGYHNNALQKQFRLAWNSLHESTNKVVAFKVVGMCGSEKLLIQISRPDFDSYQFSNSDMNVFESKSISLDKSNLFLIYADVILGEARPNEHNRLICLLCRNRHISASGYETSAHDGG